MMNWFDYLLIFIFILSLYNGFKEGFVRQIVGLASFFLALYFSLHWSGTVSEYLQTHLSLGQVVGALAKDEALAAWLTEILLGILAFLLIFFVVAFLLRVISRRLKVFNKIPVIGPLNASLGSLLGIIKGFLVIFLVVALVSLIEIPFWCNTVEASVIVALSRHYMAFLFNLIYFYVVDNLGQLV